MSNYGKKINLILIAFLLLANINVMAQKKMPFSIYLNANYAYTVFDVNTAKAGFGELGVRFNAFDGLQIGLQATYHQFTKDQFDLQAASLYSTTLMGAELNALYEFKVQNDIFIGPGLGFNVSTFKNETTFNNEVKVSSNLTKPIYVYRLFVNARKALTSKFDIQGGLSWNMPQSKYMEGVALQKKGFDTDNFLGMHVGVVYHLGSKVPKRFSRSRRLRCPRF